MKKTTWMIGALLVATLATSCEQNREHEHSVSDPMEEHDLGATMNVQLNKGALWKANPETTQGILNMMELMDNRPEVVVASLAQHSDLRDELQKEFNMIFKRCTMTGKAHEQLHNYLLPMKELFEDLGSTDKELSAKAFDKLRAHLNEYNNYFE